MSARDERNRIARERRAEADRLLKLASPQLLVLTITCVADHKLIDLYRIGGQLVWKGRGRWTRATKTSEGFNPQGDHRTERAGSLGNPAWMSPWIFGPVASCRCGSWAISEDWLNDQIAREDLPKSRRVAAPWATRGRLR